MKTNTQLPYLGRLDKERLAVFDKLSAFANEFVLAGGTALMLRIGHRLSYDFDCFSEDELSKTLLRKAKRIFGRGIFPRVQTPEQLTFTTPENVEVTFVYHPYPPLANPLKTSSIPVFHPDDLAANKTYTIGRRGVWRDYVDLFILLKWDLYSIFQLIELAEKKFSGEFHDKLFLEQLSYFDDVEIIPVNFLKESYSPQEIQSYLKGQVENYLRKVLG